MDTLQDVYEDVLNWFGSEEAKVAAYLKPIIDNVVSVGKTTLLTDISNGLPTVAAALLSGGEAAALTAAETVVKSVIEPQAVSLGESTITALAASLAATAAANAAATPAPAAS